jgi:hypothetical protein
MPWPKEVPVERYPSDLTDEEWQLLEPVFEEVEPYTTGRPRTTHLREMVNAIFYLNKTPPVNFPVIRTMGWAGEAKIA